MFISETNTIREALEKLNQAADKVLFLTTAGRRLTAALTDGDVRRYLLAGGTLDDPASAAANHHPITARSREEAEEKLARLHCIAIPVVRADGTVEDVVLDTQTAPLTASYPQLALPVVIMAGGKGTRLEPYTKILPKPLIPVGELPIMEHIMRQFRRFGCTEFHSIVNYKKQLIKAYFSENEQPYDIRWYDEDKPLGTGGGLSLLKGKVDKTFFLTNCDVLILTDYEKLLRFHRENGSAVTMVCAEKRVTVPYGVIEADADGAITAMREKPEFSFLTNTGLYLVEPEVLCDIAPDVLIGFPDIIAAQQARGRKVSTYTVPEDDWLDMGQMDELKRMEKLLRERGSAE